MVSLIALLVCAAGPKPSRLAEWGAEAIDGFQRDMYRFEPGLYHESADTDAPASIASVAMAISALTAAAQYDEKFVPLLQKAVNVAARYWDSDPPVGGYATKPLPASSERTYADNALLAAALSQAAAILKSSEAAANASKAMEFALSGTSKTGGLDEPGGKTAFGSAATTFALLALSPGKASDQAIGFYEWVRQTFRDSDTNLFKASATDANPHAADVGLMIEDACYLYTLTHDEKYAEQSRRLEAASLTRWNEPDGSIAASLPGASTLIEAWLLRIRLCPHRAEIFGATQRAYAALEWLHKNGHDRSGHYGARWDDAPHNNRWRLIDQAAAARAYFVAAATARAAQQKQN